MPDSSPLDAFIDKWAGSGGAERANAQSFLNDLADVLGVPRPDPTTGDAARALGLDAVAAALATVSGSPISTGAERVGPLRRVRQSREGKPRG